jgi:hypothetical protein
MLLLVEDQKQRPWVKLYAELSKPAIVKEDHLIWQFWSMSGQHEAETTRMALMVLVLG